MGHGSACHSSAAGMGRLESKAAVLHVVRHGRGCGLVGHARRVFVAEKFYVPAKRNRGNLPACAITVIEARDLGAKTDRKYENPDATNAGHQKVAKLMKENDNGEHKQERHDIADEAASECA